MKNLKDIQLGWIGTGVMGSSMFLHLLENGYNGYVYNRTKNKTLPLIEKGAKWVETPKDIAAQADIIFTMVGYPSDVEDVYFGENGILKNIGKEKVMIDMTTTSPSLAIEIYKTAKSKGSHALDAPVSGGDVGARNASLSIMAGGDKNIFEYIRPLFNIMGKNIIYQGNAGSGQHTKMCNQIVIASAMIGVCESLLYSFKSGLNPETMLKSISGGAAACWTLDNLAPRILNKNFEPGFFVDHFIKDMGIILEEAKKMNLVLPGLALVHQLYIAVKAKGYGKKGTQALFLALEELSGK